MIRIPPENRCALCGAGGLTTMRYEIVWRDGSAPTYHDTYGAACDAVLARFPDAVVGHDGDLSEGGDRTLCWSDEADAQNDDGQRTCAAIYPVRKD